VCVCALVCDRERENEIDRKRMCVRVCMCVTERETKKRYLFFCEA